MNEAKLFKEEYNDWSKLYHKTLKGLEVMIDVQKQVQDMIKIAEEANTTITEMKETILKAIINNQVTNATNILGILEDLQYLVQSNIENWAYQVQCMLVSSLQMVDLVFLYFIFIFFLFYFIFLFFYF